MPIKDVSRNTWALFSLKRASTKLQTEEKLVRTVPSTVPSTIAHAGKNILDTEGKLVRTVPSTAAHAGKNIFKLTDTFVTGLAFDEIFNFTYVPETLKISYGASYTKASGNSDSITQAITYKHNTVMTISFSAVFHDSGNPYIQKNASNNPEFAVNKIRKLMTFMVKLQSSKQISNEFGDSPRRLLLFGPQIPIPFSKLSSTLDDNVFISAIARRRPINNLTPVVLSKIDVDMSLFSAIGQAKHIEADMTFLVYVLPIEIQTQTTRGRVGVIPRSTFGVNSPPLNK